MLLTTGIEVQGCTISHYRGIVSGECVLGTGFLSSLDAGIADFLGSSSSAYADKLRSAKENALKEMQKDAAIKGADAIIGVNIAYTSFTADIIGVIATGTAVSLEYNKGAGAGIQKDDCITYSVSRSNVLEPFSVYGVILDKGNGTFGAKIDVVTRDDIEINGIIVSYLFRTFFQDEIRIENICYYEFEKSGKRHLISNNVDIAIPVGVIETLDSIGVVVDKYVCGKIVISPGKDIVEYSSTENENRLFVDKVAEMDIIVNKISTLRNAKEIRDYMIQYNTEHQNYFSEDIIKKLYDRYLFFERAYGSDMKWNMKVVREYLDYPE